MSHQNPTNGAPVIALARTRSPGEELESYIQSINSDKVDTSEAKPNRNLLSAPVAEPSASTRHYSNLLSRHKLLEAGMNSTYDALLMLDLNGDVRFSNEAFKSLFMIDKAESVISSKRQLITHAVNFLSDAQTLARAINQTIDDPYLSIECEFETKQSRCLEAHSKPHTQDDQVVGQVWTFRDVTLARLKEEESKHRAYHDSLTGLPNRRLLSIRLNQTLATVKESGKKTAVLFIDLDGFKDVNDSLGHNVGDALLKEVSDRLECVLPAHTFLARHGGDEFVAVMEHLDSEEPAIKLSHEIINCFSTSFELSEEELYMSVSIGIALAPEHGTDADKLVSNADMAMYQAKQQGKHTFELFTSSKDTHAYQRLKIRNQINVGLEQKEFELYFQPKICLASGSIKGAEALIRWRPNGGAFRSPMEFIPIAEESGQIIPISQWVIERCFSYMDEWKPYLEDDFILALNISAKHFQKRQLQDDIARVLSITDVDPSKIELEVTETAIMDNLELAVDTLNELKKMGIRTAIDDFGTGHSSLSYLRKLPIEILKIDKSFIDEILISSEDRTLVRGIIEMVHALGIEVVAEGVENYEMAELLMEMNCDLVQGFHYCRPISEPEFIALIKSRQCYL
jgi:diguanylate cyclase (GGDEF)-like protein